MSTPPKPLPRAERVDVMLLLEGTFPYVSGGVSSWVNQIVRGFPELTFGAVFIGSRRSDYGEMKYALPDNLVHLECHYMHEFPAPPAVVFESVICRDDLLFELELDAAVAEHSA